LANTGASDFKALLAVGLVGMGILLIAYVRRPEKS
jgi:LPXTG-motif cell wall-anchored protein